MPVRRSHPSSLPSLSRRHFLHRATATTLAFAGAQALWGCGDSDSIDSGSNALNDFAGFGDLRPDPNGIVDLPEGLSYQIVSEVRDPMDDGLQVPNALDGMAAFPGPDGLTVLVRNQELLVGGASIGPYGEDNRLLELVDQSRIYDLGGGNPPLGGTTTVVYDTASRRVVRQFLSLGGTLRNCAGGATPWGTWISCEEAPVRASQSIEQDHGYNFEVPADANGGLVPAVPLIDMGRFNHEAVAVDPNTGILYQTEDRQDSCFYRFLPNEQGNLAAGGRLQAMVVLDQPTLDARNWNEETVPLGASLPVTWVDLEEPTSPRDDLRYQAQSKGAALFARGEGMWTGTDGIYFVCTSGGRRLFDDDDSGRGQVWRYVPGTDEKPPTVDLIIEPNDISILNRGDNITVAPWGDLLVCEDSGANADRLVGFRPDGRHYFIAANAFDQSEVAGATFSPDGTTLFINFQFTGKTLAIFGPWPTPA